MTEQEIFNKVYLHLKGQGCKAGTMTASKSFNCAYRGPNNTSCAVGCLIPDELYDPEIEGVGVGRIGRIGGLGGMGLNYKSEKLRAILTEIGLADHLRFLVKLQLAHDGSEAIEEVFENLEKLAKASNLTIPEAV